LITIVTASGVPALSATNSFAVVVNPLPDIGSVTFTNGGFLLTWYAPTNDIFQVQWTTDLVAINWTPFPGNITSTNGTFTFTDTNAPLVIKFYQLVLLP